MRNFIIFLSFLLFITVNSYSQEILTPLNGNPQLKGLKKNAKNLKSTIEAVKLPFIDDFSNYTLYPDSNLWEDNFVFINAQYAIFPPSIGVATFDALNESGIIYPSALISQFAADTLTSRPIRLDTVFSPAIKAITLSDSLYFSFYFQPGGGRGPAWERLGDAPEPDDSLVLEFYSPPLQTWKRVWSTIGMPLDSIYKNKSRYFKYVIIPLNDTAKYYKNGFKFRFTNYCSLGNNIIPSWSGNCDQWNIDYVYLGINRTKFDTVRYDLTFVEKAPSFLKNYQAMPASQFVSSEVVDTLNIIMSNIDGVAHASSYKYEIYDQNNVLKHTENRGFENIQSFWTNGYQSSPVHSKPPVSYFFPQAAGNKSYYEIRHILKEGVSQDSRPQNDTNSFIQNFADYYAYDDGTAENGYGLTPAGSRLAYQFNLNHTDTLVAVDIFFNSTFNNSNLHYFFLNVWKDNGSGKPGDTIYKSNPILPNPLVGINEFHTFLLDRQLIVDGKIYVGVTQTTDDNMNIGFDRNTSSESRIFYNSGGSWINAFYKGSLMIRPVFGADFLGINDAKQENSISIYPNPLKGELLHINIKNLSENELKDCTLQIYDVLGSKVYSSTPEPQINLNMLKNGIYFVNISNPGKGIQHSLKLIIAR